MGRGIHSYRIMDIAVVDVIMTILLAIVINYVFPKYSFKSTVSTLFITGIIMHRLFCVRTKVDKLLFN